MHDEETQGNHFSFTNRQKFNQPLKTNLLQIESKSKKNGFNDLRQNRWFSNSGEGGREVGGGGEDVLRQDYPRSGKSLNSNISFTMEQECESDRNLYGRPFVFDAITDLFLEVWRWGSWIALYNQIVTARKFIHPVTINTYVAFSIALLKS